ncbi:serine hydrolase domain-containing protein [Deminuibacter soli]|uniref:Class A beta-lactamase-related serine hydrolase n=1 Tax=Deminuibacter soli TaxID=2291815 RepID=A0A3E1NKD0_9BACT|nr:serine hydrolase domain-containing protein [Deminuibacter soli]RFM28284.1 class A beta-lactamase-related serine hydrolase [Deminuibacter soli]
MKKMCLLLLCCTAFSSLLQAQVLTPEVVPQQNPEAAQRLARIDTLVNGYLSRHWINGVVTLVIQDGKVLQYKGYGYANAEQKKPMQTNDLFRLASQTKAVVSTGIMLLYEQGKLYLDEPVADFIPAFAHSMVLDQFNAADTTFTTVPAKRPITIRDLLTHTSGIDYAMIGTEKMRAIYAKSQVSSGLTDLQKNLRESIDVLAKLPLAHQPGEKFTYGLSTDVLGCVIETISGVDLETFLTRNIFIPLGMKDTYFNVPASKAGRLTSVYTEDSLHHVVAATRARGLDPDYPLQHKQYFSGGAGLTSTAFDYAMFLQMLLNGGKYNGHQLLAPRTVQLMTSGQLSFLYNGTDNFGLGFNITSALSAAREARNEGSFSWGGYFGTTYWVDPKARLVCLIMTQQAPNSHGELARKIEQLIYQALL